MFIPPMDRPIEDMKTPDLKPFLQNLQGNILQGHGRDHATLLFITFGPRLSDGSIDPVGAKAWIRSIGQTRITSAYEQEQQKTDPTRLATFQTLALSSRGYEFLSLRRPRDGAFRDGMQKRGPILNDAPVTQWEAPYQVDPENIHALLLIANKDAALIANEVSRIRGEIDSFGGRVLIEERAEQLKDSKEKNIEHFGYRDGVSQPLLIRDDDAPKKPEFDQHAPLKLALTEDPAGSERFGSYLVFRKLEQNPSGFEASVNAVTSAPGSALTVELAGAMTIGRFKDGTPVVTHTAPLGPNADLIDFDYSTDKDAEKCPFHAHIRKVNPRGEIPFIVNILAREQKRRIVRRAITYGARPDLQTPGTPPPVWGVGLLFMCYQNDIADQFEFIQDTWANNRNFLKPNVGLDPVIGQSRHTPPAANESPSWPNSWGSATKRPIPFDSAVRLKGGEYFFVPSMETLRTI
ncbi:MAG: Multifunctional dye peroxidase DyP2 [Nitrospira sp.]|nr:Multifunctional dye peroxidase DyP2 [Nitrospira sp.]